VGQLPTLLRLWSAMQKTVTAGILPCRQVGLNGLVRAVRISDEHGEPTLNDLVEALLDVFAQTRQMPGTADEDPRVKHGYFVRVTTRA